MNTTNNTPMETALKTLWGASAWPFSAAPREMSTPPAYTQTLERLKQCIAVRSNGILWGPNGIGKSSLIKILLEQLPEKSYRSIILTHSTLTGSDLIRYLCGSLGLPVALRRSDNLITLRNYWDNGEPQWPLLILEEAQNLSAPVLEELRLMTCQRRDVQSPFSLLFVGDTNLLARLQMGINRPLLTRMGFCMELGSWDQHASRKYLGTRLKEVGIHENPFTEEAEELLLRIAGGIPRLINHLGLRSLEESARENLRKIEAKHVEKALQQLPWLGRIRGEMKVEQG